MAVGIWTVRMLTKLNNRVKKQSLIFFGPNVIYFALGTYIIKHAANIPKRF